eukprot:gene5502-6854_t
MLPDSSRASGEGNELYGTEEYKIPVDDFKVTLNLVSLSICISDTDLLSFLVKDLKSLETLDLNLSTRVERIRIAKGVIPNTVKDLSIQFDVGRLDNAERFDAKNTLEIGSIPEKVERLSIEHVFIKHDPHRLVPLSVTDLTINYWSYSDGETDLIPSSVKILRLQYFNFTNPPTPGCFSESNSITELYFGGSFFRDEHGLLPGTIPSTVKTLALGNYEISLEIGVIPPSVESLKFCKDFNQKIQASAIPDSVKELTFDAYFELENLEGGVLPNSLTSLCWDSKLPSPSLPNSLTRLCVNTRPLNHPLVLEGIFPSGLKKVYFMEGTSKLTPFTEMVRLPSSVEHIELGGPFNIDQSTISLLPSNLESLKFKFNIKFPFYIKNKEFPKLRDFITDLISNRDTRITIEVYNLHLVSLDRNDPYVYFKREKGEGFILKSNLPNQLLNLINDFY